MRTGPRSCHSSRTIRPTPGSDLWRAVLSSDPRTRIGRDLSRNGANRRSSMRDKLPAQRPFSSYSPGHRNSLYFPYKEEVGSSSLSAPTSGTPYGVGGFVASQELHPAQTRPQAAVRPRVDAGTRLRGDPPRPRLGPRTDVRRHQGRSEPKRGQAGLQWSWGALRR